VYYSNYYEVRDRIERWGKAAGRAEEGEVYVSGEAESDQGVGRLLGPVGQAVLPHG